MYERLQAGFAGADRSAVDCVGADIYEGSYSDINALDVYAGLSRLI